MRRPDPEKQDISDDTHREGFAMTLGRDEARRQLLAGGAVGGFIFLALMTSVLFGTW